MHIVALGLHLTDRCNVRCLHCAYHCGPEARDTMDFAAASKYLEEASRYGIEVVCISGGEPLLFPDLVKGIAEHAKMLEMRSIWLFTNSFWATSLEGAEKRLARLKGAGVTRLCTSADGFHQPFIPIQRVRNAITAASKLEMETVLDTRIMGVTLQDENPVNRKTLEIFRELGDLVNVETWWGSPLYVGRAAETLPPKLTSEPVMVGGSCYGPWSGGSWRRPLGFDIDSHGEVTLCPGVSIGNITKNRLTRILSEYSCRTHPILRLISNGGPEALAEMAQKSGYRRRNCYVSACHLCYDVRRFLRTSYPLQLAPLNCYEEPWSTDNTTSLDTGQ